MTGNPALLSDHFAAVLQTLRTALSRHTGYTVATGRLARILWNYLNRLAERFARLANRTGPRRLYHPRPGRKPPPPPPTPLIDGVLVWSPQLAMRTWRMPGGKLWLVRLIPGVTAAGSQLQYMLTRPDMQALLESEPRAHRLLRPICRALGVPLPPGPPPVRRPRPPKPPPAAAPPPEPEPEPPPDPEAEAFARAAKLFPRVYSCRWPRGVTDDPPRPRRRRPPPPPPDSS